MIDPHAFTPEMLELAANQAGYCDDRGPMFLTADYMHTANEVHVYAVTYPDFDAEDGVGEGQVYLEYNEERRCWTLEF